MNSAIVHVCGHFPAAALAAGTSSWNISPVAGDIIRLEVISTTALDVATLVTLELGGVLVTGSNITVTTGVAGTVAISTPTAARTVAVDDPIEITSAGSCTVGDINYIITIQRSA
jgi:hypothetical protein